MTLTSDRGHDICVLCGWQDEDLNWEDPRFTGGPNGKINLYKHQKNIIRQGFPYSWKEFRDEQGYSHDYEIDKHWEPFLEDYVDFRFKDEKPKIPFFWMVQSLAYKEYEEEEKEKRKK